VKEWRETRVGRVSGRAALSGFFSRTNLSPLYKKRSQQLICLVVAAAVFEGCLYYLLFRSFILLYIKTIYNKTRLWDKVIEPKKELKMKK